MIGIFSLPIGPASPEGMNVTYQLSAFEEKQVHIKHSDPLLRTWLKASLDVSDILNMI